MKILVIGGCGYIGSLLSPRLCENYEVSVLDNMTFGNSIKDCKKIKFIKGDITNLKDLNIIKDFDIVVLLAAIVGDPACNKDISHAFEVNINGTKNVVEFMKLFPNKKLIFASSCSVYGKSEGIVNEESPLNAVDYYGQTKIAGEKMVKELPNYLILRFGTAYGLSNRMRFDLVVNSFIKKGLRGEKITVFGGKQHRPFIHVKDIADAIEFCIEKDLRGTYNFVNENMTIEELGVFVSIMLHCDVENTNLVEDKRDYIVDGSKLQKLGFTSKYNVVYAINEIKEAFDGTDIDLDDDKYYNDRVN